MQLLWTSKSQVFRLEESSLYGNSDEVVILCFLTCFWYYIICWNYLCICASSFNIWLTLLLDLAGVLRWASLWFSMLSTWSCYFCRLCQFWSIVEFEVLVIVVWKRTNWAWNWRNPFGSFCRKFCVGKIVRWKSSPGKTTGYCLYELVGVWVVMHCYFPARIALVLYFCGVLFVNGVVYCGYFCWKYVLCICDYSLFSNYIISLFL